MNNFTFVEESLIRKQLYSILKFSDFFIFKLLYGYFTFQDLLGR